MIAAELCIIETLQYELQWAGPMLYVDRFLQLMSLTDAAIIKLCQEFCNFAAMEAKLCLELKQSELAAAVVTSAINVLTSVQLCKDLDL